jgi:hypothetical protein
MTAGQFRIYDPLRAEWATPHPAATPMTQDTCTAALHDSEATAIIHGRQVIGSERPWLVIQATRQTAPPEAA